MASPSIRARQPGSTMLVPVASVMIAGPSQLQPAGKVARSHSATSPNPATGTLPTGRGTPLAGVRSANSPAVPIASQLSISNQIARSGEMKPNRARCAASNACRIAGPLSNGTASG